MVPPMQFNRLPLEIRNITPIPEVFPFGIGILEDVACTLILSVPLRGNPAEIHDRRKIVNKGIKEESQRR